MTLDSAESGTTRWYDSDVAYAFRRSPMAMASGTIALALVLLALAADVVAPFDAFDPAKANVVDARLPPGAAGLYGDRYLLGTDPQGRDFR